MTIEAMKLQLAGKLSKNRYIHSINVMKAAEELALRYGENVEKASIAGILHDCAKYLDREKIFYFCEKYNIEIDQFTFYQPGLLHGPIGASMAQDFYGVSDPDILHAIYYHTTGCENMTMLDKVIFLADYIELGRDFEGVQAIRDIAFIDIEKALELSFSCTIKEVLQKGNLVYPITLNARNYLIFKRLKEGENSEI